MMRKLLLAFASILLTASLAVGQVKDDPFAHHRVGDPIKSVSIFPNPAVDFINVKFEAPIAREVRLTVHNVIGNAMELESEIIDEHEIKIRVKDLSTGYYLISVKDEHVGLSNTYKFLKR